MTAPTKITVVMSLSRETPGTYVYTASGKSVVPTLYIQKRAFDGAEIPDQLIVTIEPFYAQANVA